MKRQGKSLVFIAGFIALLLLLMKHGPGQAPLAKGENTVAPESAARSQGLSNQPNTELALAIDRQLDKGDFGSARWGVCVISLKGEQTLYSRNADQLFTPASNMKIYTTGVALNLLGADYRWRTSIYATTPPDVSGILNSDLVLYGRGAPDLTSGNRKQGTSSLAQLADDLYQHGLRRVRGNVIGDESYFTGEVLGDGWQWTDVQWYFGAEPSALSINDNEIDLNILPPRKAEEQPTINLSDPQGYVTVQNRMATVGHGRRLTIGIQRGLSDNLVKVWGEFPLGSKGYGARLSVHNPALWAAHLFAGELKSRGISIDGEIRSRDARVPVEERFDPTRATELAAVLSKPLGEIVRVTNKESINLNAELLLRTFGHERRVMIPESETVPRERGDDETGVELVRLWLSRSGISTENLAIHDGSGLSRLNLVTPTATARLLLALAKTGFGEVFRESLPVSGRDGTLGGRLNAVLDRVSAKTGTITYDNSLSGYVYAENGEILVFSVMCNDHTRRGNSTRLIDEIVTTIAAYPKLLPPK